MKNMLQVLLYKMTIEEIALVLNILPSTVKKWQSVEDATGRNSYYIKLLTIYSIMLEMPDEVIDSCILEIKRLYQYTVLRSQMRNIAKLPHIDNDNHELVYRICLAYQDLFDISNSAIINKKSDRQCIDLMYHICFVARAKYNRPFLN